MKNIFVFLSGAVIGLILGLAFYKPQEVIKYVDKEVKVYDFSQEPKVMQYYAGMMGKMLINQEELDKQEAKQSLRGWRRGYEDGYREARSK